MCFLIFGMPLTLCTFACQFVVNQPHFRGPPLLFLLPFAGWVGVVASAAWRDDKILLGLKAWFSIGLLALQFGIAVGSTASHVSRFSFAVFFVGVVVGLLPSGLTFAVLYFPLLLILRRLRRFTLPYECRECGYCLIGLTSCRCPECGATFDPKVVNSIEHSRINWFL